MRNRESFFIVTLLVKLAMVVVSFLAVLFFGRRAIDLFILSAHSPILAQLLLYIAACLLVLFTIGWFIALLFSIVYFFIPIDNENNQLLK